VWSWRDRRTGRTPVVAHTGRLPHCPRRHQPANDSLHQQDVGVASSQHTVARVFRSHPRYVMRVPARARGRPGSLRPPGMPRLGPMSTCGSTAKTACRFLRPGLDSMACSRRPPMWRWGTARQISAPHGELGVCSLTRDLWAEWLIRN
jgi:hypothetical protein